MDKKNEKIIQTLLPSIALFRSNPHYELEGSIGIHNIGSYKPGVDFAHFKSLFDELLKAESIWSSKTDSNHFATFYFDGNLRGRYNTTDKPNFVRKRCIAKTDFSCPERKFGIRVSVNCEEPCEPAHLSKPLSVRLHERWNFVYKNTWRYDLSKVAQGATKAAACGNPVTFDIELEVDRSVLNTAVTDRHLTESFVCKLLDLLGRYDHNRNEQNLTLHLIKNESFE